GSDARIARNSVFAVLRIETIFPEWGGNDRINVGEGLRPTASRGSDIVIGGTGDDIIHGGWENGSNIHVGDCAGAVRADGSAQANDIYTTHPEWGGVDIIIGGPGGDVIIGGTGLRDHYETANLTGTYNYKDGVLAVTAASAHGYVSGQVVYLDFASGM